MQEGENIISIWAEKDGNESETITLTLYLDTESPTSTIWTDYDPEDPSYDFTVNWSSFEDPNCTFEVQYRYRAPGESWTDWTDLIEPGTSSTLYNFTAENGKYKFKARATDLAENTGVWSEVVVVEVEVE